MRTTLRELEERITGLDTQLSKEFPEYSLLASPSPVTLSEIRQLLGDDETLVSYLAAEDQLFVWVVRAKGGNLFRLNIGEITLSKMIRGLREGLDLTGVESPEDLPPFDVNLANEVFRLLIAPLEQSLSGVQHTFWVLDAALESLPLGVLVTDKVEQPTDLSGYRQVPWLAERYAMTTLPSVSSFRALRRFARNSRAGRAFIGIGDPLLDGHPEDTRGDGFASLFDHRGIANVQEVRALPALPDTAGELEALAGFLNAGSDDLFLRERATEEFVRLGSLSNYRVIAFATHGLVAGELVGLSEPALVLTPPDVGTEFDDGLLKASEVALLDLDADWVILSACNTAGPDGSPGAGALSGLAKSFFYAGSRALLVSHWPVESGAAVQLTTGTLAELSERPGISRAEALRRSMLKLMTSSVTVHPNGATHVRLNGAT